MLTQKKVALPFDGGMELGAFHLGIFPQVAGKQREETAAAVAIRRSQELDTDTAGQDDSLAKGLPSWRAHPRFQRPSQIGGGGSRKSGDVFVDGFGTIPCVNAICPVENRTGNGFLG